MPPASIGCTVIRTVRGLMVVNAISIGQEEREIGGSCARDDVGCINASVPAETNPFNAFLRVNGLSIGGILLARVLLIKTREVMTGFGQSFSNRRM